jgi:hypothetical protein
MKGTVLYSPRDVRFEERDEPKMIEPTDAIIRISATCVCGSDLWPYRPPAPVGAWATSASRTKQSSTSFPLGKGRAVL